MHGDVGARGSGLYCASCERTFHGLARCPSDGAFLIRIAVGADPLVGAVLEDRYRIEGFLGAGGMGTVYRGMQLSVDREVAIKVLSSDWARNPQVIKRFLREARLASQLSHPNAVSVLDFGQTPGGLFYLVMELLSGRTLEAVLDEEPRLAPRRVAHMGAQIASALAGAHRLAILHRDLKPSNIILLDGWRERGRDRVKVVDFGIAKSQSGEGSSTITEQGAIVGTPAYMPPEVIHGGASDHRGDLYSLGVVLYELASGTTPYVADSVPVLIAQMALTRPRPAEDLGVSPPLARVIGRLMARDPTDRYHDATEAMGALREAEVALSAMETAAITAVPPEAGAVEVAPGRGTRWPLALAGLVAIMAVAAISGLAWFSAPEVASGAAEPRGREAEPVAEPVAEVAAPVAAAPVAVDLTPPAAAEPPAAAPTRAAHREERKNRRKPKPRARPVDVDAVHDPFEP